MADENIDVRFIGEQLARVLNELGEVRQELAAVHSGQNEIAVEVAVLGANVPDVKETLNIIEHDISAFPFVLADSHPNVGRPDRPRAPTLIEDRAVITARNMSPSI